MSTANYDLLQYVHSNEGDFDCFLSNLNAKGFGRRHYIFTTPDKTGHPWSNRIYDSSEAYAVNGIKGDVIYLRRGHRYFFTYRISHVNTEAASDNRHHGLFFTEDPAGGRKGDQTVADYEPREIPGLPASVHDFKTFSFVVINAFPKICYYQDRYSKFMGGLIIVLDDDDVTINRNITNSNRDNKHHKDHKDHKYDKHNKDRHMPKQDDWDVVEPDLRSKIDNPKRRPSPNRGRHHRDRKEEPPKDRRPSSRPRTPSRRKDRSSSSEPPKDRSDISPLRPEDCYPINDFNDVYNRRPSSSKGKPSSGSNRPSSRPPSRGRPSNQREARDSSVSGQISPDRPRRRK